MRLFHTGLISLRRYSVANVGISLCALFVLFALCTTSCEDEYSGGSGGDPPVRRSSTFTLSIPASMYSDAAGKLTTLYGLAAVNPDQVPEFVRENRAAFEDTGQLQQCAFKFRQAVVAVAIRSPGRNEIYGRAMDLAGSDPKLIEIAGQVADDQTKALADLMLMSRHLTALSNAVPGMLIGDDGPYHETLIYQVAKMASDMNMRDIIGDELLVYIYNVSYGCTYSLVAMASQ